MRGITKHSNFSEDSTVKYGSLRGTTPALMLGSIDQARLAAAEDDAFVAHMERVRKYARRESEPER